MRSHELAGIMIHRPVQLARLPLLSSLLVSAACGSEAPAPPGLAASSGAATSTSTASPSSAAAPAAIAAPELEDPAPIPPDTDPAPPPAPQPPAAPPLSEAKLAAFLAKPSEKVTAEVFETALLRLASCTIEPGWVGRCAAHDDLMKVVERYRGGDGFPGEPALRHLRHPALAVRGTAVSFASRYAFGGEPAPEREQAYLDAMRSEKDVDVLESLVRYGAAGAARHAGIRRFVLQSLAHADERVRASALGAIGRSEVATQVPEAFLHVARATKADRTPEERIEACLQVGNFADPRAVALLAALLDDASLPFELRGACFEGLVGTWTRTAAPLPPSREGYEHTLRLLGAKPRSVATPHARGLGAIAQASGRPKAWAEQARGFYDVVAVSRALSEIVLDDDAGTAARSAAAKSLVALRHGETIDPTLEALKKRRDPLATRYANEIDEQRAGGSGPLGGRERPAGVLERDFGGFR